MPRNVARFLRNFILFEMHQQVHNIPLNSIHFRPELERGRQVKCPKAKVWGGLRGLSGEGDSPQTGLTVGGPRGFLGLVDCGRPLGRGLPWFPVGPRGLPAWGLAPVSSFSGREAMGIGGCTRAPFPLHFLFFVTISPKFPKCPKCFLTCYKSVPKCT